MPLLTLIGGILIGALFYAACFHVVAGFGRSGRSRHRLVAAICIVALGFSFVMLLALREASAARLLLLNRIGLCLSVLVFPLMVYFYDDARRRLSWRWRWILGASALLLLLINLWLPQGLQFAQVSGVRWHLLPWDERYAVLHGRLHPFFGIGAAWTLALTLLSAALQWSNWRHSRRPAELVLLAGVGVYLVSMGLGIASRAGLLNLHFAGVYGLAAMVLSISLVHVHDDRRGRQHEAQEKQRHRARLDWLARHDALTGLPNRAALEESLQAVPLSGGALLALLGIDRLGRINEAFGHDCGDAVLRALVQRLQAPLRTTDRIARLGGDLLCLLLDGEQPQRRLQALLAATRAPLVLENGLSLELGVSGGHTALAPGTVDLAAPLQEAESALALAKRLRRGNLAAFDPQQFERSRRWTELGARMRSALAAGEFRLVYQPRLRLADERHAGFEALLRWRAADGEIEPGEFVRIAEESGCIVELGEFVLAGALAQLLCWRAQGLAPGRLALNLSMRQLADRGLAERIAAAVAAHGLAPREIEFELTETAAMEQADFVLPQLDALAAAGFTLALDDFGTGYSSLARLQGLPFGVIKIDISFVQRLGSAGGEQLMRGMLGLVHDLGREAVAEGVETPAQRDWLRAAGCAEAQGWLYARALEAEATDAWLRARSCSGSSMDVHDDHAAD
ncbi:MAG: hypothetical protein AMXMBFR25_07860 [Lysobacterales bacterium]